MKPFMLMILLLTACSSMAFAQQRTRDVLFPDFQKDIQRMNASHDKDAKLIPSRQTKSTKEALFTNYRPQTTGGRPRGIAAKRTAGKPMTSDQSGAEAVKAIKAGDAASPRPGAIVPTQGDETKVQPSRPAKN
jgi:hypothetical protein